MIRLEEDVVEKRKKSANVSSEKHVFAQDILKKMKQDNIAPTPYNFQIYFEMLLEETTSEFQKEIDKIRQTEATNSDEQRAEMEKEIKEGFSIVKNMVQSFTTVYKNISLVKGVIQKRTNELSTTNNQLSVQNITTSLKEDINKFDILMARQLSSLKNHYEQAVSTLKTIEQGSIYDTRYSIYNRKYLLETIHNEGKSVLTHGYSTSLMLVKIKDALLSKIPHSKDRLILTKNIAKLLQRTSKRSDVVAYFSDGVFAMLMRHTDIDGAKKACERISNLVTSSSFFIGEMDIDMDIEMAITKIDGKTSTEETLALMLDALPKSSKSTQTYIVVEAQAG